MTHRLLILSVLLFLSFPALSQKDKTETRKGYIGFGAGPSFPVGNFGSSDWNSDQSGFAVNGFQFTGLEFGYKFIPNFGLAAAFKGANIPMDVQKIADYYAEEYGGQFRVESSRWNYGGLYVGPFVSIPSRFVDVDFKFMTGFILAFSPRMEITRDPDYVTQSSATGPSFSLSLGVNARIHLTPTLSLMAGVDYLSARPIFNVEYESNGDFQQETVYQSISTLNLTAGFAFRIFKEK